MSEEEFQNKLKGTRNFCIFVCVIFIIGLVLFFATGNIVGIILSLIFITLLSLFYFLTKKKLIAGPIIGIILGALYILQFNLTGIVLGIIIILDCAAMIKYISNLSKQ